MIYTCDKCKKECKVIYRDPKRKLSLCETCYMSEEQV